MEEKDFTSTSYKLQAQHLERASFSNPVPQIRNSINRWRHDRMYDSALPLIQSHPNGTWLTIGDGCGEDAHYLLRHKIKDVMATDISDGILKQKLKAGFVTSFQAENAEKLSFENDSFDFVLCKESYHHFPRPMIAFYEMLRVAKNALILIEPMDANVDLSLLQCLFFKGKNGLKKLFGRTSIKGTPHRFEEVGNYLYSISKREIEKASLGIGLRYVAFRCMNDYFEGGLEKHEAIDSNKVFRRVTRNIGLQDFFSKLGFNPWGLLTAIVFKDKPDQQTILSLQKSGFEIVALPINPYVP